MERSSRLRVGLVGTGRLGALYAQYIATQIPEAELFAVAGHRGPEIAAIYGATFSSFDRLDVINHPHVDAVVICSHTETHTQFILEAFRTKKPVFCEKPLCLDLADTVPLERAGFGHYLQVGFMRRYDPAYVHAKGLVDSGAIGKPVVFKATSRDKTRTSIEYAQTSGGMLLDLGIHDIDLARWFMGEIESVTTIGDRLVFPELAEANDIDNAIVTLRFESKALGVIDLSRNAGYGYDISTEILGTSGALRIGALQGRSVLLLNNNQISHDTIPSFMERFEVAFIAQLRDFVLNVQLNRPSPVTLSDGIAALRVATAAQESLKEAETCWM